MTAHDDAEWVVALPHREPEEIPAVADRFTAAGIAPEVVTKVVFDLGDQMLSGFVTGQFPDEYGGLIGVALLAAEVEVFCAHAAQRAARARADALGLVLATGGESLAAVASRLGITKQTLHRATKRPGALHDFSHQLTTRTIR